MEFIDVFRKIEQLENKMKMSSDLSEEQKLSSQIDIQNIKDQLLKPSPDKSIIKKAMESIAFLGSISGLVELYKIAKLALENFL